MATPEEFPKYEYRGRGHFEPAIPLEEIVFNTINKLGPIKRGDLVKVTGVPRTTLFDVLDKKLIPKKRVWKYRVPQKRRGRPWVFYTAKPPAPPKAPLPPQ